MDIRQTQEYAHYLKALGWGVEKIDGVYCYIKKIPFLGSVIKIQRTKKTPFLKIEKLAKKHSVFQIIIEPGLKITNNNLKQLKINGYKQSRSPYLPTKTLQLDLTKPKSELFNQLKKDCRYALRKTEKLPLKQLDNIALFRKAWKSSVGWRHYVPPLPHLKTLKKAFNSSALFLASDDLEAGAIFLLADKTAYYWQAFTSKQGRHSLSQYRIVWQGILWAKEHGAKIFDFEGIYDSRFPKKSWLGLTHFKKSFSGYEVQYPGPFVKTSLLFNLLLGRSICRDSSYKEHSLNN